MIFWCDFKKPPPLSLLPFFSIPFKKSLLHNSSTITGQDALPEGDYYFHIIVFQGLLAVPLKVGWVVSDYPSSFLRWGEGVVMLENVVFDWCAILCEFLFFTIPTC